MKNLLHPFMDQTTMRTLLAFIATSLVLNLVSGNEVRSDLCPIEKEDPYDELYFSHPIQVSKVKDRQMNISETRKCYVYGQCQVSEDYPYINH